MSDQMHAEVTLRPLGLVRGSFQLEVRRGPSPEMLAAKLNAGWLDARAKPGSQDIELSTAARPFAAIDALEEFVFAALRSLGFVPMVVTLSS